MATKATAARSRPAEPADDRRWNPLAVHLRNTVLRAARDLDAVQDQIDCAELALASGYPASAGLLYAAIFLASGFSPAQRRGQAGTARRIGIDLGDDPLAPAEADASRFSVDIAVADLTRLLAIPHDGAEADAAAEAAPADLSGDALGATCERLGELLRRPDDAAAPELAALLASLRWVTELPEIALDERLGASLPDFIGFLACNILRDFLRANRVIAYPPHGSAALLRAAAQLDEAGFRPYFRNVAQLIRGPRDIFALIQLAGAGRDEQGGVDRRELGRWAAILSVHLDKAARLALVDEIADLGLTDALEGQLQAVLQRRPDVELLWRIRDAALDTGDMAVAIRAQEAVRDLSPRNAIEWTILGEIAGTAGEAPAAEAALLGALRIAPQDQGIMERLVALAEGRFQRFRVTGGFGTPHHRRQLRRRRASAR